MELIKNKIYNMLISKDDDEMIFIINCVIDRLNIFIQDELWKRYAKWTCELCDYIVNSGDITDHLCEHLEELYKLKEIMRNEN